MLETSSLLELPLVIFRLILERLHREDPEAFYTFRLVCRTSRNRSEAVLFQSITLDDQSSESKLISSAFIERLQDAHDALAENLRHLSIGPFDQNENCLSDDVLERIVTRARKLQTFSWNCFLPLPDSVLSVLHSRPTIEIWVTNNDRRELPIDEPLLSSPQLYSLEYTVYQDGHTAHCRSEFAALKDCLMRARSLRQLRLHHSSIDDSYFLDFSDGAANFPFQHGDYMPELEEIGFDFGDYHLSEEHCLAWKSCMNWGVLHKLDLDRGSPHYLLSALTGKVPNLKVLHFGFWEAYANTSPETETWTCRDLQNIMGFLDSIDALEDIVIKNWTDEPMSTLWPGILEKHGPSLRKLDIEFTGPDSHGWNVSDLAKLQEKAPSLELLHADFALRDEGVPRAGVGLHMWRPQLTETLVHFQNLRHLKLKFTLLLYIYNHNFVPLCRIKTGPNRLTQMNEKAGAEAIKSLCNHWLQFNPDCTIEDIDLTFRATQPELKEWSFKAARVWEAAEQEEKFSFTTRRLGAQLDEALNGLKPGMYGGRDFSMGSC